MKTQLVNGLLWAVLAAPIVNANASIVNNTDPACSDVRGTPFCTISAAIDVAQPDSEITVVDGVYPERIQVMTDGIVLNTTGGGFPTINGAFLGGIGVQMFEFDVQGGGITARTLPGVSNCTEVVVAGNLVTNGDIVIDRCDSASISENVVTGGGISVSFSGNVFFFDRNIASGNDGDGFSLFMSNGAILNRKCCQK